MSWSSHWAAGGCETGFRGAAKCGKLHSGQVKVSCAEKKSCEARGARQLKVACRSLQRGSGSSGSKRRWVIGKNHEWVENDELQYQVYCNHSQGWMIVVVKGMVWKILSKGKC